MGVTDTPRKKTVRKRRGPGKGKKK